MLVDSDRFRRQKLLAWLGEEGQLRLGRAGVLIARSGGLGGPLLQSLALGGLGRAVFFHPGALREEDLHRMVLAVGGPVGESRVRYIEAALRRLGPQLDVRGFDAAISPHAAARWMRELDLAIGAAPTFEERLVLNDAACGAGKPMLDAAMHGDELQILCVRPQGPCLRCLVPEPPPWDDDFPVFAAVSAVAGNLAALLAARILTGRGEVPWGELLHLDLESFTLRRIPIARRRGCPVCG